MTDYSKFLSMGDYIKPSTSTLGSFGSDTNYTSGDLNFAAPDSGSFMDSMQSKGNPWGSTTGSGGGASKGFNTLGLFGAGAQGLSALGSLMQAYTGSQQLKLGRDSFNFQKGAFNQNSANQARLTNSELEDRQRSRISGTGNNNANNVYEGLDSYMAKNRVSVNPI